MNEENQIPNYYEESKKKKKSILPIILLVVAIVFCVVGAVLAKQYGVFPFTKKEKTPDTPVIGGEVANNADIELALADLTSGLICNGIYDFITNGKKEAKDVSSLRAYTIAEQNYFHILDIEEPSLEDFQNQIKIYLGENYVFHPEEIDYNGQSCPSYRYDAENKKFVKQETACGGSCGAKVYQVSSVEEKDGTVEAYVKIVFYDNETNAYYADPEKTTLIADSNTFTPESLESGEVYKFIFQRVDDKFQFVSSEKVIA